MTGRADVTVGARDDVLLLPVNAIFDQQGTLVAHVVGTTGAETRRVALGESNDAVVEVVSGVREGEKVLLSAPAAGAAQPAPGTTPKGLAAPAFNRASANALQPH
jgi:hypothetical protein